MSGRALQSFLSGVIVAACASGLTAFAQSTSPKAFSIQVGAFPSYDEASGFINQLERAGEHPVWGTADIPGRGTWVRVLLGSFPTVKAAREHAVMLETKRLIHEFLIKEASEFLEFSARMKTNSPENPDGEALNQAATKQESSNKQALLKLIEVVPVAGRDSRTSEEPVVRLRHVSWSLDQIKSSSSLQGIVLPPVRGLDLASFIARDWNIPRATESLDVEPPEAAVVKPASGGLWLGGDVDAALVRLRWIAGPNRVGLISVGKDGRVTLDRKLLARECGITSGSALDRDRRMVDCIESNEGMLLLTQVVSSSHRYLLHVATSAPTLGGPIAVQSALNFDNRFDSRINPRRPHGHKYANESPPAGFDDLIAISPEAEWVNLKTGKTLPQGIVTFHELAEAYSKIDLKMEYLPSPEVPGAHETAVARELKLQEERPGPDLIVSEGRNRVFETEAELVKYRAGLRARN